MEFHKQIVVMVILCIVPEVKSLFYAKWNNAILIRIRFLLEIVRKLSWLLAKTNNKSQYYSLQLSSSRLDMRKLLPKPCHLLWQWHLSTLRHVLQIPSKLLPNAIVWGSMLFSVSWHQMWSDMRPQGATDLLQLYYRKDLQIWEDLLWHRKLLWQ